MGRPRPAPAGAGRHYRRWSPNDDKRLCLLWGEHSLEEVARKLGRSVKTVYWRARKLKLPCGVPQGMESLTDAARRTGFTTSQFRRILGKANVRIRRTISRPRDPSERVTDRTFSYVDPAAIDLAVERWSATEVVHAAAVARGLNDCTLRAWLMAAGHKPPPSRGKHWRVPTTVIDEVIAARRAGLSVCAHARRVGVTRNTLAMKLRRAGVLGPKRPGVEVRLPAAVVDEALRQQPLRRCRRRTA